MRRKSDLLKACQGTFRQDRARKVIDLPVTAKPEMPLWLDDIGQETWGRVTEVMSEANLSFDVELLAAYCDCYSHLIKCSEKLRTEGYTLTGDSGLPKINPTVNALRELQKTLIDAGKQLGLSVGSRAALGLTVKKEEPGKTDFFLQGLELRKQGRKGAI